MHRAVVAMASRFAPPRGLMRPARREAALNNEQAPLLCNGAALHAGPMVQRTRRRRCVAVSGDLVMIARTFMGQPSADLRGSRSSLLGCRVPIAS